MTHNTAYDFDLQCQLYNDGKEWNLDCKYKARSNQAINEFGKETLAYITLEHDPIIIQSLQRKYGKKIIPKSTAILTFIVRLKNRDPHYKLQGIGMVMLCSLLKYMYKKLHVTHIYLIATTTKQKQSKLIKFYHSFGYHSINPKEPKHMIAYIPNIAKGCIKYRKGRSIPLLIRPHPDSPKHNEEFDTETYPDSI